MAGTDADGLTLQLPPGSDDPRVVGNQRLGATGGAPLSIRQKVIQLLGANLAYLEELPGECRWVLASRGLVPHRRVARIGIGELPDTSAVELAMTELERYAEGETELLNHSYRTFHFAELLYRQVGCDNADGPARLLAVAALLHDAGVYPKGRGRDRGQRIHPSAPPRSRDRSGSGPGGPSFVPDLAAPGNHDQRVRAGLDTLGH